MTVVYCDICDNKIQDTNKIEPNAEVLKFGFDDVCENCAYIFDSLMTKDWIKAEIMKRRNAQ